MRIYLDSCVFQDLKKGEYPNLLSLIKSEKEQNIYCFSEAHLYDLARDKGNDKYDDMRFIEEIVEDNCFFYDQKICFEYITPIEFFNSFDWSTSNTKEFSSEESMFSSILKSTLKAMPLNLKELFKINELPEDFPKQLTESFSTTTNFYEFFCAFVDYTNELTNEQKKFKELVQYLHKNTLTGVMYEAIGIEGYDGNNITDRDKFSNSYSNFFLKANQKINRYNLFIQMYNSLETLGLVKGLPRKQKMMNLINDSRHAFFGAFCDIVVSKDKDFINKTKFMYEMHGFKILVFNIPEFENYITNIQLKNESFLDLLTELSKTEENNIIEHGIVDDKEYFLKRLSICYFGNFNILASYTSKGIQSYYFLKNQENYSTGTLTKEIEYVTNKLINELGTDINNNGYFHKDEITSESWEGRAWIIAETLIKLNIKGKLYLGIYPSYIADVKDGKYS